MMVDGESEKVIGEVRGSRSAKVVIFPRLLCFASSCSGRGWAQAKT